jgi:hypothetical protein
MDDNAHLLAMTVRDCRRRCVLLLLLRTIGGGGSGVADIRGRDASPPIVVAVGATSTANNVNINISIGPYDQPVSAIISIHISVPVG